MPKKIIIIPDSFKDSISSTEFCKIAEKSLHKINPKLIIDCFPTGDGGEGSLESFRILKDYVYKSTTVKNPLGENIKAKYCINKKTKTGIIELAQASGIQLVPPKLRNPLKTTSYGTGQLINKAISDGMKKIIIFIGGSATNDAGIGILDALGFAFYDSNNNQVIGNIMNIDKINKIENSLNHDNIDNIDFVVGCDVTNPLTGPMGATYFFGKQKGATNSNIKSIERKIIHFSNVVIKKVSEDHTTTKGAGAAGGIGFTLLSFLNAKLEEGFPLISKILELEKRIKTHSYDWIITGEGCMDKQTKNGKLVMHVGSIGLNASIPVIAFSGKMKGDLSSLNLPGITSEHQITLKNIELNEAIQNTTYNLKRSIKEKMGSLLA